jgi:hypothetical protein
LRPSQTINNTAAVNRREERDERKGDGERETPLEADGLKGRSHTLYKPIHYPKKRRKESLGPEECMNYQFSVAKPLCAEAEEKFSAQWGRPL